MNIFKKIGLIRKFTKAVEEVKETLNANNAIADKIAEIIGDVIEILNKLKELIPTIGNFIDEIIAIIKKWFKK